MWRFAPWHGFCFPSSRRSDYQKCLGTGAERCSEAGELFGEKHTMEDNHVCSSFLYTDSMAAAGYSLIYLLMGGGLGEAILIFIVAKMLGR